MFDLEDFVSCESCRVRVEARALDCDHRLRSQAVRRAGGSDLSRSVVLVFALLCFFSLPGQAQGQRKPDRFDVVVLDAGHGGDAGCLPNGTQSLVLTGARGYR